MSSSTVAQESSSATFLCDEKILKLFPLKSISDVVQLFRVHLECAKEPDLTLLSIVTGIIENTLTSKCNATNLTSVDSTTPSNNNNADPTNNNSSTDDVLDVKGRPEPNAANDISSSTSSGANNFPLVTFETVKNLYEKFMRIISLVGSCKRIGGAINSSDSKKSSNRTNGGCTTYATRELIKHVSDVIWNSLIRSTYKDRAHLQSLYSYLADNKLDCFGVAFGVVAGCQVFVKSAIQKKLNHNCNLSKFFRGFLKQLGYGDVHLAISEDHAWVLFGKTGEETVEVTWHGKGNNYQA